MSNLKELRAAMPKKFVDEFKQRADVLGMTTRQLTAFCIATGFKLFTGYSQLPPMLLVGLSTKYFS